jgi:hypothetical protein
MSQPPEPVPPASPTPQPTPVQPIDKSSPNNVRVWVRKSIEEGRMKNCAHLGIGENVEIIEESGGVKQGAKHHYSFFTPTCTHRSFVSLVSHLSDEQQADWLRNALGVNPLSCPKDCTFYKNSRWAYFKSAASKPFKTIARNMKALMQGYTALPWQTQCG